MTKPSVHGQRATQALAILEHLEKWVSVAPFRRIVIEQDESGKWHATLETRKRAERAGGRTMTDALAQVATTAAMETDS